MALKDLYIIKEEAKIIPFPSDRVKPTETPFGSDASVTGIDRGMAEKRKLLKSFADTFQDDYVIEEVMPGYKLGTVTDTFELNGEQYTKGQYVLWADFDVPHTDYESQFVQVWAGPPYIEGYFPRNKIKSVE